MDNEPMQNPSAKEHEFLDVTNKMWMFQMNFWVSLGRDDTGNGSYG